MTAATTTRAPAATEALSTATTTRVSVADAPEWGDGTRSCENCHPPVLRREKQSLGAETELEAHRQYVYWNLLEAFSVVEIPRTHALLIAELVRVYWQPDGFQLEVASIAKVAGCDERTVQRAMASAEGTGLLRREEQFETQARRDFRNEESPIRERRTQVGNRYVVDGRAATGVIFAALAEGRKPDLSRFEKGLACVRRWAQKLRDQAFSLWRRCEAVRVKRVCLEDILRQLDGVRPCGAGWTGRCPCHDDRVPSLTIAEGYTGIVLTCHAGCDRSEIIAALGLTWPQLFNQVRTRWPRNEAWHFEDDDLDDEGVDESRFPVWKEMGIQPVHVTDRYGPAAGERFAEFVAAQDYDHAKALSVTHPIGGERIRGASTPEAPFHLRVQHRGELMNECPSCSRPSIRRKSGQWGRWCRAWLLEEMDFLSGDTVVRLWRKTET